MENIFPRRLARISAIPSSALFRCFFAGLLLSLGFAPFHWPLFSLLSIALLFTELNQERSISAFKQGLGFGFGFFGVSVSWIYISIHLYGHLNPLIAGGITLLFISYLALFTATMGLCYRRLNNKIPSAFSGLLFSATWTLTEVLRSYLFTGFPWLLLGLTQVDTPLKTALPIIGIEGLSFISVLLASLVSTLLTFKPHRWLLSVLFVGLFLFPWSLLNPQMTQVQSPLRVSVIQANFSMREKWDEHLFDQLLYRYDTIINSLINHVDLIVLPEAAIPLPAMYVSEQLERWDSLAKENKSAIVLGIPEITTQRETDYYNTMMGLGVGQGTYRKQHLVPFGEYVPAFLEKFINQLTLPMNDLTAGKAHQALLTIQNHPVASLICYELAYPNLLRQQLPQAEWIISVSDDGWFGHSFAMYQQLQMAQALAIQTQRYHILANNDGLSSIINPQGEIIASVPAFKQGTASAQIYPQKNLTLWVKYGDRPIVGLCLLLVIISCLFRLRKTT